MEEREQQQGQPGKQQPQNEPGKQQNQPGSQEQNPDQRNRNPEKEQDVERPVGGAERQEDEDSGQQKR